jgi:hypothetical protein
MSDRSSMFLVFMGILLAMGGVGGTENAVTDLELVQSSMVALVGVLLMWCGTLGIQQNG